MKISHVVGFVAFCAAFTWLISAGLNAQELQECNRWTHEADGRKGWYSTELQRAQCHAHGITLPDVPAYLEVLKREAPETLTAPIRSDFVSQETYERAVKRFALLGYWASEAPQY